MKFSAVKESILPYIQYANSFTSPKNLNTHLQNIYLEVEDSKLIMKATNYQIGFKASANIQSVAETGVITVSGKTLMDVIKEMPDGSLIDFYYDGSRLNIKSGKSSFKLSTADPKGFPVISDIPTEYYIKLDSEALINLLKRTYFCISNESQKIEYTGAQFNVYGNCLEMFATGLQRVAIASTLFDKEFADEFTINIPKKTVQEIIRILENCGPVEIETDRKQVSFKTENITVYSKLIDKFVKGVNRLFENEYPVKAKLERKKFIEAAKRVSAISSNDTPGLMMNFSDGVLSMASLETEYGQGSEVIDNISFSGDNFDIILNAKHVTEILANIDTDFFTFEMIDRRSPVLITPDTERYRYLVVPISIDRF